MNLLSAVRVGAIAGACLWLVGCGGDRLTRGDEELGLDPEGSPAELYVRMAEEYYGRGQTEIAFRRALQALEADDKYPPAHVWIGFLYEDIGQLDKARRHYERALALSPKSSDARYAYGAFLCRQKRYGEADVQFEKALENPLYATPWIALTTAGQCARDDGDGAKAERYYRAAIAASPNFGPALVRMAELELGRGDAKSAKSFLDRYFRPETLRTPATAPSALLVGAKIERQLGNTKRAAEYEKVLRANFPGAPEISKL